MGNSVEVQYLFPKKDTLTNVFGNFFFLKGVTDSIKFSFGHPEYQHEQITITDIPVNGHYYIEEIKLYSIYDLDKDGFKNDVDECPKVYGLLRGCPDSDKDGLSDKFDFCVNKF